jgi:hypothetical protein
MKNAGYQSCAVSSAIHFLWRQIFCIEILYLWVSVGDDTINIDQTTINVKSLDRIIYISIFY